MFEDLDPSSDVGKTDDDCRSRSLVVSRSCVPKKKGSPEKLTVSVKSTRSSQSFVEGFGEIGSGNDDDALSLLEPIELDQKLIESLLHVVLILSRSLRPDSIQLVDEDDCRSLLSRRGK